MRSVMLIVPAVLLLLVPMASRGAGDAAVAVVAGKNAPELEKFAATELCGYLDKLFGVKAKPVSDVPAAASAVILIGSPDTNPAAREACQSDPFPKVSDQGMVFRTVQFRGHHALIVGGGSPRATMWAVYDLAEQWGVRYLLHGDILPAKRAFVLPNLNSVKEPVLRVRQWRVINDFACGPESWGIQDYRPVLNQLAKMKFNRIFLSISPWQPFLDLQYKGVKREKAWLWYDYHYPVTDDMVGRKLFGNDKEFCNPDLPMGASYKELSAAGENLVHRLMTLAHERGMQCVMSVWLTEFPPEFASVLSKSQKVRQLGELDVVPTPDTDINDPALTGLAAEVLRTTAKTYPEVDYLAIAAPEFRSWTGQYEQAWKRLDSKYGLESTCPLASVMAAVEKRKDYPGGLDRARDEVKADIVALDFSDRLLSDSGIKTRFIYNSMAQELFPIMARVAPAGSETMNFLDYTPARAVKRREALAGIPARDIPCTLITSLHDDNMGLTPQLMAGSLHELVSDISKQDWAGVSTRYWLIGDHDPTVAYLARAAWDPSATPTSVLTDQVRAACGQWAVQDMLTVFHEVESATDAIDFGDLGFGFPVPGMMTTHCIPGPIPEYMGKAREAYRRALTAAESARAKSSAGGRSYADYWIGRLRFGIGYIDTIEIMRKAAAAEQAKDWREASRLADLGLQTGKQALQSYADVARDRSDIGAIAILNQEVYRPLLMKSREMQAALADELGWKEHPIRIAGAKGGSAYLPGEYRFLHKPGAVRVLPWGILQMDDGEIILLGAWYDGSKEYPVAAMSKDNAKTWSDWIAISGATTRPLFLTNLGGGHLSFIAVENGQQTTFFSSDYGRTWPERVAVTPASDGGQFDVEGNPLVDRDARGRARTLAQVGYSSNDNRDWPRGFYTGRLRWSKDGGRTWEKETAPPQWRYEDEVDGKKVVRGVSEGSLVRAANGWIVAALRTDMPARYLGRPNNDSLEGLAISISKDNGKTWTPLNVLFDAGRHHPHLLRMPNGDIVMTYIVRDDIRGGRLASYRRGCEALISHDNGLTWDTSRRIILDEFEFNDGQEWFNGETGHLYSALLKDGSILTCYGNYRTRGCTLIHWRPGR